MESKDISEQAIFMQNKNREIPDSAYPFKELLTTSGILFYHCSLDENFPLLFISDNVKEILGFETSEFFKNDALWRERLHPDDRERVLTKFQSIFETESFVVEFRFRHQNNEYVWMRDEVKLVYGEDGEPESIVGSSINITSRKQAEDKLHQLNKNLEQRIEERTRDLLIANKKLSEQKQRLKLLQMAVANINDMVIVSKVPIDDPLESEIVFVNKAFETFTGYSYQEVKNKNPILLHGKKTSRKTVKQIQESILKHEPVRAEFVNYTKHGKPYWVELDMSPFPVEDEDHEYWVGINRDITKRKQTEKILEESEQKHRAYTELSFDAIFEIRQDGMITDCNKRACEMFGYKRKELIGMNTLKLIPEEYRDSQPDLISDEVTTGSKAWERTYRKKDGTQFPTEINTKLYKREGKKRLIAYVRDITEQKENEKTIKNSLKEKETLLAEIHHRVKNNLAIISGLLEMQTYNAADEAIVEALRESQSRIQSIAMVHEKLYRSDSFNNIPFDKYLDELLSLIAETFNGNARKITVKKNIKPVFLDVNRAIPCGLIFNELITNAYKHAFTETDEKEATISVQLNKNNRHFSLEVRDNGCGLPEEYTINQPQSLGTTLIQTLVEQLDGNFEFSSNNGAYFKISFELD